MISQDAGQSIKPETKTKQPFPGFGRYMLAITASVLMIASPLQGDESERTSVSLAERRLQSLVQEKHQILESARTADGNYDEASLQRRFQDLVNRFDRFLGQHPDLPAGYVAYGRVLERIGQDDAARAMYLRANQLDPNIPLVKNQLGNYLAEEGEFDQALAYYLAAIELEPGEPLYHFQLGQLLHHFRDDFLEEEVFPRETLDEKMLKAFSEAANLAPENVAFRYRHAEAYYDLEEPQWEDALESWEKLRNDVQPGIERQTIDLHKANIALKRGKPSEARNLLDSVDAPVLQQNRQRLLQQLEEDEEETDT